jgi:Orn/Lys/Arg decarboxylase, N-terminal domain.
VNDLKIAASNSARDCFRNSRAIVALDQTDFTDVAGAVFSRDDLLADALETIKRTGFDIPIFLVTSQEGGNRALDIYKQLQDVLLQVNDVFDLSRNNVEYYGHPLETAAKSYEDTSSRHSLIRLCSFSISSQRHCFAPTCATPTRPPSHSMAPRPPIRSLPMSSKPEVSPATF